MRTALKVALFLEIVSGAFWTIALAMIEGSGGLGVLGIFVLAYSIQAICFLIGLWAYWRHREARPTARWVLALPFVFLFLPGIIKTMAGGALTASGVVTLLLIMLSVILIACLIIPGKVAGKFPDSLFRSRVFNSLLLIGPLLGWLILIGILVWMFGVEGEATSRSSRGDSSGYGAAYLMVMAAIYLVGLGGVSLVAGVWAWLGLNSGIQSACRKINIAQMVVAVPGLLLGGFSVYFLLSQN